YAMNRFDPVNTPTCLERDFNIPPVSELLQEISKIRAIQTEFSTCFVDQKSKVQKASGHA
ncbi:MAG: hypothetical protein ACI8O8_001859, partial [Oleiphilaceae bacterium]